MSQHKWLALLLVASLILVTGLSGCGPTTQVETPSASPAPADATVSLPAGSVSAEAVIEPYKNADLRFRATGPVEQILVAEGDSVIAGQELARLDSQSLQQAVLRAEAGLKSAQAQLAKAQAGARPEELAVAEAGLQTVQAGYKAAQEAVKVADGNLTAARADVTAANEAVQVANSSITAAKAALKATQANLTKLQTGPTKTDIQIAEKNVDIAKDELWYKQKMRDYVAGAVYPGELEAMEIQVALAELQLEYVKLGSRPEDIAKATAQVSNAQAGVKVAEGQAAQAVAQVALAEAGVVTARAQLGQAQAQAESAEAQVEQVQAQVDLVKAGTRTEDIAAAEAQVALAEANVAQAENAVADTVLRATFDGTIGSILIDEGELVSPQILAMQLGDLTRLRAKTDDLSEVDVSQVGVGQKAQVKVDALGGKTFDAVVSNVAPVATTQRGDKVYTVILDLSTTQDSGLRWGMTAFVDLGSSQASSGSADPGQAASGQGGETSTISAEGEILPHKKADLSFNVGGTLQQILVSEGDSVAAGQELAKLDTRDLEQAVQQAEAGLKAAQAELAKAKAGARPEEVAQAEAKLAMANADIKSAESGVEAAVGAIGAAQANADLAAAGTDVAQAGLASAQATLAENQAVLDKIKNGPTELERKLAEKQVEIAKKQVSIVQSMQALARNIIGGKVASAQAGADIAQLQLEALLGGARTEDRAAVEAQVTQASAGVQTAKGQLAQAQAQLARMQAGVLTAQVQAAQAQAQVDSAKAQAVQAQAELDLLKAGSRAEDIAVAEASVAQAEAGLAEARNALGDAVLKAPFAGTVGLILVNEGELVSQQYPVMALGDLTELQAQTQDLSEVDVSQVQVGQNARVTVDALGGRTFSGIVSRIASLATEQRGDTVYAVTIDLDVPQDSGLRWGMTAFVEITGQ